jgi:hypothetical protein
MQPVKTEDEQPDPRDAQAWDRHVRSLVSEEQIELLKRHFRGSQVAVLFEAGARSGRTGPLSKAAERRLDLLWRAWCLDVLRIELDVQPGGRAVLRHPVDPYRVEIQWMYDDKAEQPSQRGKITGLKVVTDQGGWLVTGPELRGTDTLTEEQRNELEQENWIGWPLKHPPDVEQFIAALNVRLPPKFGGDLSSRFFTTLPRRRPQAGQPLDPDFYRRVLAVFDELTKRGARDPAAQIAERMGEKPSTVRSWLRRGRSYIGAKGEAHGKG